jgi:multidrug efflux pump subunit AcrA (membrane-fusion protein)
VIALAVIAAVVAMCAVAISLWQAREAKNAQQAADQAQEAAGRAQEEAQAARKAVEQAASSALHARTALDHAKTALEEAKRSAVQAQEAATASRMLADEAQLTAQQATQQVSELTEVLAAERSRRGMPTFAITPGAPDEFRLSYFGGPAVIEQLTVSVVPGSRVLGLSQHNEPPVEHLDLGPLHNGTAITFRAATGQRASAVFQIKAEPWEPVVVRADQ